MDEFIKKRVYLETSVVSYITARMSQNLIVAAHQQITQQWWDFRRTDFDLYISQLVLEEVEAGDQEAARKRLQILVTIPLLELTIESTAIVGLEEIAPGYNHETDEIHE